MKYRVDKEVTSQLRILGESFDVTINYNLNCDNEVEIYHADLDICRGHIEIMGSWLETQHVIELLEDICWRLEN